MGKQIFKIGDLFSDLSGKSDIIALIPRMKEGYWRRLAEECPRKTNLLIASANMDLERDYERITAAVLEYGSGRGG